MLLDLSHCSPRTRRRFQTIRMARFSRAYKEAMGCLSCGERRADCLQFHHNTPLKRKRWGDRQYKAREISSMSGRASLLRIVREMEVNTVLCANCHAIETARQRRDSLEITSLGVPG